MTERPTANIAVEGELDQAVLTTLLSRAGIEVQHAYGKRGKDYLRRKIKGYSAAARHGLWVVLVDLNNEADCAPLLVRSWLPQPTATLQLRVAVRAVEAWLLADRDEMARFLRVSVALTPADPEGEMKPKLSLVNIARRSRNRGIREDIAPGHGSSAKQGPAYTSRLIEFTRRHWNPERAARRSASLKRSLVSLSRWAEINPMTAAHNSVPTRKQET